MPTASGHSHFGQFPLAGSDNRCHQIDGAAGLFSGSGLLHFNLHKTFSTPHEGGGPGSGPVGVIESLKDFLPSPIISIIEPGDKDTPPLYGYVEPEKTIGRVKAFVGQFGMMVRAYTNIRMHGASGLRKISEFAVLNANYLIHRLKTTNHLPYDRVCMHSEFVVEGTNPNAPEIHALDIAKRLMDYGLHPPTNYFPLIVHEALMIDPTETESLQTLDYFADTLLKIYQETTENPDLPRRTAPGR